MIVRVSGTLSDIGEEAVVVERDGLAYEVLVPRYGIAELAACRGLAVTLHTMEYLEGNLAGGNFVPRIVGFLHPSDRAFFEIFLTVKGIGVRKALRALAEPVGRIAAMIEAADTVGLSKLPGIGRRTADTVVAELRGKLKEFGAIGSGFTTPVQSELTQAQRDALELLVNWGDGRADAERWLARAAQLHAGLKTADEWVRAAYRIKTGAEG